MQFAAYKNSLEVKTSWVHLRFCALEKCFKLLPGVRIAYVSCQVILGLQSPPSEYDFKF